MKDNNNRSDNISLAYLIEENKSSFLVDKMRKGDDIFDDLKGCTLSINLFVARPADKFSWNISRTCISKKHMKTNI